MLLNNKTSQVPVLAPFDLPEVFDSIREDHATLGETSGSGPLLFRLIF